MSMVFKVSWNPTFSLSSADILLTGNDTTFQVCARVMLSSSMKPKSNDLADIPERPSTTHINADSSTPQYNLPEQYISDV